MFEFVEKYFADKNKSEYPDLSNIYDRAIFFLAKVFSDKESFEWFGERLGCSVHRTLAGYNFTWDSCHTFKSVGADFCLKPDFKVSDEGYQQLRLDVYASLPEDVEVKGIMEKLDPALRPAAVASGQSLFFAASQEEAYAGAPAASLGVVGALVPPTA